MALNNENVTFNDDYKKILRYYGFDLENEQLPILPPANSSNDSPVTTTMLPAGSETTPMTTVAITAGMTESSTASTKEETTANPNVETVDVDIRTPTEDTTMSPSSAPNAESTTIITTLPATETTAVSPTLTETPTVPPTETTTTTSAPPESTTILISTASSSNTPMTPEPDTTIAIVIGASPEADAESIAQQTSQATSALTEEPTTNNEVVTLTIDMGAMTADSTSEMSAASLNEMTESVMMTSMSATTEQASTVDAMTAADSSTTVSESSLETLQRRKKSIVDFIFTNPPYVDDYFFYRSYNVGPDISGPGFDDKMFLANGLKNVQVSKCKIVLVYNIQWLMYILSY